MNTKWSSGQKERGGRSTRAKNDKPGFLGASRKQRYHCATRIRWVKGADCIDMRKAFNRENTIARKAKHQHGVLSCNKQALRARHQEEGRELRSTRERIHRCEG